MSLAALSWALRRDGIRPTEKLVLLALADYADRNNECFPSITTLAATVGVHKSTVQRSLSTLVDAGHIAKNVRTRPDGSQTSNSYTILLGGSVDAMGGQHQCDPKEPSNRGTSVTNVTEPPLVPFSDFKDTYPRRVGAQGWARAKQRWEKLSEDEQLMAIVAASQYADHLRSIDKVNTPFVQMASTFLAANGVWREWVEPDTKTTTSSGYIRLPKELPND